jgi:uncharacterized membrane protein (UPF0127 family)
MNLSAQRLARTLRGVSLAASVLLALPLSAQAADNQLTLHTGTGDYTFNVDVVDTPDSRAKGLMFVTELADDAGMLFDFKEEREVSFWMRNTFIPLDMIFIGTDGVVRNVHANARPHDVTSIPSDGPVQFVLEIPGGRAAEIGLAAGDTMDHDRVVKAN